MTHLIISGENLTSLEGIDLTNVTYLDCINNSLTSLPALPQCLLQLRCGANRLTSLPTLPIGLKWLECEYNLLTSLPLLPEGLETLGCEFNRLTSLPLLPEALRELNCEYNLLTSLPLLPEGLEELICVCNKLVSLPILPLSLSKLRCAGNYVLFKTNIDDIKLDEYNQMRKDMGWKTVSSIRKNELKEMREKWKIWQYRLDGAKYNQAEKEMNKLN